MTEPIKIKILNFEKFNPRTDIKRPSWIRFENNFFDHPDFFDFTMEERSTWLYLLCYASRSNVHEMEISAPHFTRITASAEEVLHRTIEKLKRRRMVETRTLRGRYVSDTSLHATNETNETNERTYKNLSTDSTSLVQIDDSPQTELLPVAAKARTVTEPKKTSEQLISEIPRKTFERWSDLYDDPEFLQREVKKAILYYENTPKKLPKNVRGWTQTLNTWFARGWDYRAKTIKGTMPTTKIDIDAILKELENDKATI